MDSRAVAVLHGSNLYYYPLHQGREVWEGEQTIRFDSLDSLAVYCDRLDIRAVWLLDGQQLAPTDSAAWWEVAKPRHARTSAPQGTEIPTIARVQRHYRDPARPIHVYDLGGRQRGQHTYRDTRWPWWHLTDPDRVAAEIAVTERAIKRPLGTSPGAMGLELITETNRRHLDWLDYHTQERLPHPRATAPQWCQWPGSAAAELYEEGGSGMWLHLIDTNAAYLAAAQSTPLGVGALTYHPACTPGTLTGIYHVTGNLRGPVITREGWYDAATVRAAVLMGQPLDELPCWLWSRSHATLRGWAETLWQARERADGLAREAVKSMYTASIGLMGSTLLRESSAWFRPLWQAAIVAEAGRRQWYRVWQLRAAGVAVCYLDVDTIGYLSSDGEGVPETAEAVTALLGTGLGKYKGAGSHPVTPALARALAGGSVSAVKRLIGRESND